MFSSIILVTFQDFWLLAMIFQETSSVAIQKPLINILVSYRYANEDAKFERKKSERKMHHEQK